MLNNNIFSYFTEKPKFCDAFNIVSSILIRVTMYYFLFCELTQIVTHKHHTPLYQPCADVDLRSA